jgi:hypothetical protein
MLAHQFLSERRHENHTDSFRKNTTINCTVLLFNFLKLSGHLSFREAFEATIIADYDARSAVEREFVLRLASVLWRLRRAAGIETSLFQSATKQSGPISIENIQPSHDGPISGHQERTENIGRSWSGLKKTDC